jgi:hypothetical protein
MVRAKGGRRERNALTLSSSWLVYTPSPSTPAFLVWRGEFSIVQKRWNNNIIILRITCP